MIRVLLLEREPLLQLALANLLSSDPEIEVVGAVSDCASAIDEINTLTPDVVLMDAHCGCTWKEQLCLESSVVAFSSSADQVDVLKALQAGVRAYILKTSPIDLLTSAIKTVACGALWLDPAIGPPVMRSIADNRYLQQTEMENYGKLSTRELEVVSLLCEGLANDAIAKQLYLSKETVKTHVRHVMEKLHAGSRTDAAIRAVKLGLLLKPAISSGCSPDIIV